MKTPERIEKILTDYKLYDMTRKQAVEMIMKIVNENQGCENCKYEGTGLKNEPCISCVGKYKFTNYEPKP